MFIKCLSEGLSIEIFVKIFIFQTANKTNNNSALKNVII